MYNIIIVAHPDDEVFWMGGNLMRRSDEKWHIICVTYNAKTPRGREFRLLCRRFKWGYHQLGFKDHGVKISINFAKLTSALYQELRSYKRRNLIKHIYTHNHRGEYHHLHHRQLHKAVRACVRALKYRGPLDFFGWDTEQGIIEPEHDLLLPEHFKAKRKLALLYTKSQEPNIRTYPWWKQVLDYGQT